MPPHNHHMVGLKIHLFNGYGAVGLLPKHQLKEFLR